jgi:signal transduction histidine kinase
LFEAANIAYAEASLRGEPRQFDRSVVHPSGLRHLQVYCAPRMRDGMVDGIFTFVVDVTARVDAELALQDMRAELASARERERIADDLHNMVIQRLFAAGLVASRPVPSPAPAQVQSVQDGIVSALDDLEAALTSLHEKVQLAELLPDLARLVHNTLDPRGVHVTIENVGSVEYVPPTIGTELLAAAGVALTGAAVRYGVKSVVVTIAADARTVWLRVVDDGSEGPSEGDPGVRELMRQADRLHGGCRVRPATPSGTVLDWRVPLTG